MAVILWAMCLSLVMQGCLCSPEQMNEGCQSWTQKGKDICCNACHPGHRLVTECGPSSKDLCKPCEAGTYTQKPKEFMCSVCRQCVGLQYYVKPCTITSDTECGCVDGFLCGDENCSFCIKKCDKGQEPTEDRFCRPCPDGTFNDQIHQKCKPFSTKCPSPGQIIMEKGTTVSDIICANITTRQTKTPSHPGTTEQAWTVVLFCVTSMVLIMIIIAVTVKSVQKKSEKPEPTKKIPIISNPTDDPRTLIAIECSFHEAQQEQGSSSESLNSKDSSDQLIA